MKVPIQSQQLLSLFIVFALSCVQAMEIHIAVEEDGRMGMDLTEDRATIPSSVNGHADASSSPPLSLPNDIMVQEHDAAGEEPFKITASQLPSRVSSFTSIRQKLTRSKTEKMTAQAKANREVWFDKLKAGEFQPAGWAADDAFLTIENLARTLVSFGDKGHDTIQTISAKVFRKVQGQMDEEVSKQGLEVNMATHLKTEMGRKLETWRRHISSQFDDFQFFLYTIMLTRLETITSQVLFQQIVDRLREVFSREEISNDQARAMVDSKIITLFEDQISNGVDDGCLHSVGTKYPVTLLSPLLYKIKGKNFDEHYRDTFLPNRLKVKNLSKAVDFYQRQIARILALKGMIRLHNEIMSEELKLKLLEQQTPPKFDLVFDMLLQALTRELESEAKEQSIVPLPDNQAIGYGILRILDQTVTPKTQPRFFELYKFYKDNYQPVKEKSSVIPENNI
ncbi:hypothetical protein CROQUDRAFT_134875 [Cronartium quercuum f. sp. fusiforme G11]|uniref:Uncharacterized protein n=1 Tax=Cronartium quercuum f. sp. fusiforme G11 TaxID=708437 RepID=A0A9P6NG48_9BASI|nr:hypothetical protein CROQUDRAFT_134875 [Cronartium quercuum f. sp. fusiforme G11]